MSFVRIPRLIVERELAPQQVAALQIPWHLADYGIPDLWQRFPRRPDEPKVKVGIVDTGVDDQHMRSGELAGQVAARRDFSGSGNGGHDGHGHGTHVAAIIAGLVNGIGGAGICPDWAELYVAKGLSDGGFGSGSAIRDGINWCVDQGCQLVNLSLGSERPDPQISGAVVAADKAGCIVVAAAGNSGGDDVASPGDHPLTIGVGAIDRNQSLARFSDKGPEVVVVDPGVGILSAYRRGGYAELSGTSMSTPGACGKLAWWRGLLARYNDAERVDHAYAMTHLRRAVDDLGPTGRDDAHGLGVIDLAALLDNTRPTDPAPPPAPPSPPGDGGPAGGLYNLEILDVLRAKLTPRK